MHFVALDPSFDIPISHLRLTSVKSRGAGPPGKARVRRVHVVSHLAVAPPGRLSSGPSVGKTGRPRRSRCRSRRARRPRGVGSRSCAARAQEPPAAAHETGVRCPDGGGRGTVPSGLRPSPCGRLCGPRTTKTRGAVQEAAIWYLHSKCSKLPRWTFAEIVLIKTQLNHEASTRAPHTPESRAPGTDGKHATCARHRELQPP